MADPPSQRDAMAQPVEIMHGYGEFNHSKISTIHSGQIFAHAFFVLFVYVWQYTAVHGEQRNERQTVDSRTHLAAGPTVYRFRRDAWTKLYEKVYQPNIGLCFSLVGISLA